MQHAGKFRFIIEALFNGLRDTIRKRAGRIGLSARAMLMLHGNIPGVIGIADECQIQLAVLEIQNDRPGVAQIVAIGPVGLHIGLVHIERGRADFGHAVALSPDSLGGKAQDIIIALQIKADRSIQGRVGHIHCPMAEIIINIRTDNRTGGIRRGSSCIIVILSGSIVSRGVVDIRIVIRRIIRSCHQTADAECTDNNADHRIACCIGKNRCNNTSSGWIRREVLLRDFLFNMFQIYAIKIFSE